MQKLKKFLGKIKGKIYAGIALIVAITIAFGTGTFNPNPYVVKQISFQLESKFIARADELGLNEPEFTYNDPESFIRAVNKCVDYLNFTVRENERIPRALIVAMAGVESAWGTSRFAKQGNALFGVRTWDPNTAQLKPLDLPDAKFGVKTYATKCQSVADVIRILNTHHAYENFRQERAIQSQLEQGWDYDKIVATVAPWSTNENYSAILLEQINGRQLGS